MNASALTHRLKFDKFIVPASLVSDAGHYQKMEGVSYSEWINPCKYELSDGISCITIHLLLFLFKNDTSYAVFTKPDDRWKQRNLSILTTPENITLLYFKYHKMLNKFIYYQKSTNTRHYYRNLLFIKERSWSDEYTTLLTDNADAAGGLWIFL